jgi:D-tyrosyl-tRNA(Tyr) deacylase
MRCVVQRVSGAAVHIAGQTVGRIGRGLVVLVAFAGSDEESELLWMAKKIISLRVFPDEEGRMNRSLREIGGGILLISQFTLYADCSKGHRPSFVTSAPADVAAELYARFGRLLRQQWPEVAEGRFGAMMDVELVNQGPVTVILQREARTPGS